MAYTFYWHAKRSKAGQYAVPMLYLHGGGIKIDRVILSSFWYKASSIIRTHSSIDTVLNNKLTFAKAKQFKTDNEALTKRRWLGSVIE